MPNNIEETEVMVGSVSDSTDDTTLEVNGNATPDEEAFPVPGDPPPKPKRTRKKKADTVDTPQDPSAATTAAEEKAVQKAAKVPKI